jgi:hypothetical protein
MAARLRETTSDSLRRLRDFLRNYKLIVEVWSVSRPSVASEDIRGFRAYSGAIFGIRILMAWGV